jgi:hypothetical protein
MRRVSVVLALPALVVALVACGSDDDASTDTVAAVTTSGDTSEPTDPPRTAPTSPPTTAPADDTAAPATTSPPSSGSTVGRSRDVGRAVADLVERAGVAEDAIVVVSSENVTWRDSSLGCPQRDMQYMQVLTDGVRIVLEVDGQRYEYHGGGRRSVFYCATPEPPVGE